MALTIDCQVHAYQRNTPERPWVGFLTGPEEVTGDDMVAAMDAVGVDGAILISPFAIYGYDASYALEVYAQHPTKFGLVRPFDPNSETIDADVEQWTSTPGVVGCRNHAGKQRLRGGPPRAERDPGGRRARRRAGEHHGGGEAAPCCVNWPSRTPTRRSSSTTWGMAQPFDPPPPDEPFADLPNVLSCAELDNVAIKISGAGTLSHAGFPYPDIWEPVHRIFDAFGLERCLWGDGLDARRQPADLRAGRGGVPADGHAVGLGPGGADGRHAGEHLQVDAGGSSRTHHR